MRRIALLLLAIPVVALAQTPAQPAKPATTTAKPSAPAPTTAAPATRKPAPAPAARRAPAVPAPLTDEQKAIYAIGLAMQRSLTQFDLSAAELDIIKRALTDAALKKPVVELDEWGPRINPLAEARRERVMVREKAASTAYLTKAATEVGVVKTASGLIYREVLAGTGASPSATDAVKVHYRGTLIDGTEFDSSYKRNEPAEFALNGVIGCWTEGVAKMKVGGKARLVCPSDIGYGDEGNAPIPGGATLIFEVELLEIITAR